MPGATNRQELQKLKEQQLLQQQQEQAQLSSDMGRHYLPPPEMIARTMVGPDERPTIWQRAKEQMGRNPLVPIGMAVTVFALGNGLRMMLKRKSHAQQSMMRLRVFGQGMTIVSMVVGTILLSRRSDKADAT